MLQCETNTPEMEERVTRAFATKFAAKFDAEEHLASADAAPDHDVFFEHGQWFVANILTGETWSVVDAVPGIDGLDFEEL